jgi:hypothetical protein
MTWAGNRFSKVIGEYVQGARGVVLLQRVLAFVGNGCRLGGKERHREQ